MRTRTGSTCRGSTGRSARTLGVRTAINPDAHSVAGLRNVRYGVNIARKAWLTAGRTW
jgi:histidinol phosphatase-like PHP family hydrolase